MKNRLYSLFLLIALTLSVLAAIESATAAESAPHNCGLRSVHNLARYLGNKVEQSQVEALERAYPEVKSSLHAVQQMAHQLGIAVEGVKISLEELERRQEPFIAVLPDHFVFVERIEGSWVRYIEDTELLMRPRTSFEQEYQGKALVLASNALAPNKPVNALRISPATLVWDKVPAGTLERKVTVILTNTGKSPIDIRDISPTCSCIVPAQWPKQIAPGQKVPLEIAVHLPETGDFVQSIGISSNSIYPYQVIRLSGSIESDVQFSPSSLDFGAIAVGGTTTKLLVVRDLDQKLPRPLRVSVASPQVTAELRPQGESTWDVAVTLKAPMQATLFDTEVLISGTQQGSRVVRIPVKAHIVPMTRTRPEQAIFGSVTSAVANRVLRVFRQDKQAFEITAIQAPPYLNCEVKPVNQSRREWQLHVKLTSARAPSQVAENLIVSIKAGASIEELSIPVRALVQDIPATERTMAEAGEDPHAEGEAGTKIVR